MDSGASTAVNSSTVSLVARIVDKGDTTVVETDKTVDSPQTSAEKPNDIKTTPKSGEEKSTKADANDVEKKKERPKPRVVKETVKGIWTIKQYESANFLVEWYKGLRASAPYLFRLAKTYYSLSRFRAIVMILANLAKIALPALELYIQKEFLDTVQSAIEGKPIREVRMVELLGLKLFQVAIDQGLEVLTDKIDALMDRRLMRVLDIQLIEAYLRLDADQIASKKITKQFDKAKQLLSHSATGLLVQCLQLIRIVLTIATSTFALTRLVSIKAKTLLVLFSLKLVFRLYRLSGFLGYSTVSRQTHPAWHRLTLAKGFALERDLRRDITVTGIAPWLTSEMTEANNELGDITTRPPWDKRASSWGTFFSYLPEHIFEGFEYIWLAFRGIKLGTSIGDLQLLRDTGNEVYYMAWELSNTAQESTSNWKNLVYFYRCLETQSEMDIPPSPEEYVRRPGGMKIEARSMRYKYDVKKDAEVLTGASFVINPGEMVAVVGFNGAGKSTLARLLARLANPTGGEFLINDINAQNYDPTVLRSNIAVLFQDIGKYDGFTILENIGVGKISELHSKDLIEEAAKAAGAHDFINKLPFKYDSYLGHKPGATLWGHTTGRWDESDDETDDDEEVEKERVQKNLSGGQWQKIALARAFMRGTEADLLVLDEPTANLDPEAEYKLFETIKRIRKGLTTVYISHRFNTVRAADKIMVMGKGTVIEFGSHDELMALKDGTYRRLYTLQAKGFQLDDEGGVSKDMDGLVINVQEEMVKKIVDKGA